MNEDRGARKSNDSSRQQRQNQNSRDGTSTSQQGRKVAAKGPNPNKQNDRLNGPPAADTPPSTNENLSGARSTATAETMTSKASSSSSAKPMLYRPAQAQKSEQPWGAKPGTMANGKDFWLELRKQVTALQQSGGASQGG